MMRPLLLLCSLALLAPTLHAQNCAPGTASGVLSMVGIYSPLSNTGLQIPYNSPYGLYRVGGASPLFAAGLWIGGTVGGQVRLAASTYSNSEFYPGPLGTQGQPAASCTPYDTLFTLYRGDLVTVNNGGSVPAVTDWPWQWGAPVRDGDGDPTNYNLAGGDRPDLRGLDMKWWVLNDAAGPHHVTGAAPIGMQIGVSAFADDASPVLSRTTFLRYQLTYRGTQPLENAYASLWLDADIGNAGDDYVGSDPTRALGYAYNADNVDEGPVGYGSAPPAFGAVVLEGLTGQTLDAFVLYNNDSHPQNGNPTTGTTEWYNLMRGRWKDETPIQNCGDGLGESASCQPTVLMYPGDPVAGTGWSERNLYPQTNPGQQNPPGDRRMLVSVGPATFQPGETREVVFALVWARGTNHLDSITKLREAADEVRAVWAQTGLYNVPTPPAPTAAPALVAPADKATGLPTEVTLHWEPVPEATAYVVNVALAASETAPARAALLFSSSNAITVNLADTARFGPMGSFVAWSVSAVNAGGYGPLSPTRTFTTTGQALSGVVGGVADFLTVANGGGPLSPPEAGAFGFGGFPLSTTADRPNGTRQQTTGGLTAGKGWGVHTFGIYTTFSDWLSRATRNGANMAAIGGDSYEWRFTGSSVARRAFDTGAETMTVPFELWNVGPDAADPSDDYRMIPYVCETACTAGGVDGTFDIGGDSPLSGGADDPISDAVYWYKPKNTAPGTVGYDAFAADVASGDASRYGSSVGDEVFARTVLMAWNFGAAAPYPQTTPEAGTIFRIVGQTPNISAPVPTGPAAGAQLSGTATQLFWSEPTLPEGTVRIVELARDDAFTDVVRQDTLQVGPPHSVWGLVPGTTYHWRVQQQAGTVAGPWSQAQSFSVSATAVASENTPGVPAELTLRGAAPHPVRDAATIQFGLPRAGQTRLAVYDVLGREVLRLSTEDLPAGWHTRSLDASSLAAGVYFLRVEVGGAQQVQPLVVVR